MSTEKLTIRKTLPDDAAILSARLRSDDRREIFAAGQNPFDALHCGFRDGDCCFTGCHDGVPMAMFGVYRAVALSGRGSIWFLGADELDMYPLEMVRYSRRFVRRMLEDYDTLFNYTDCRYERARRWLKLIGFKFYPDRDIITAAGIRFNYFEIKQGDL